MPFDTIEARKIVTTLEMHARHPGGEVMQRAADSLKEALADAGNSMALIRNSEAEALKARTQYDGAMLEIKTLREQAKECSASIEVLQQIAEMKKGASAKAREYLNSIGKMPPSPPAPEQPA